MQQRNPSHVVGGWLTRDALERRVLSGDLDTVLTVFPDMYGRLVGKRITGHFFVSDVADHGMHACDYLFACDMEMEPVPGYAFASWQTGYGDVRAMVDFSTLRTAAWLERSAIVLCDIYTDGESLTPVAVAPRQVLRQQLARAAERGWVVKAGSELELFLLRDSYEQLARRGYGRVTPFGNYVEDYHMLQGTREEPIIGAIRRAMDASGVPVEFSKGEWGPGQHEINLRYAEMLEMADRHAIYKHAAKEIAMMQGCALTFMAKVHEDLAGNSFHLHTSLWGPDEETPLFPGSGRLSGLDHGVSDTFRWYLGGLLAHARECALLFAPNVNSYKRYAAGTFAPTAIAWSYDNRTASFRVVGDGDSLRIECRIPGADANPYLCMAALLAAGLDGVANRIEPPPVFRGDAYKDASLPRIPGSLEEALECFRTSDFIRAAFGDEVVAHYTRFAEVELELSRKAVTDWERRRFLERG